MMAHGEESLNDIFTEEQAAFLEKLGYDRKGNVHQIDPTTKSSILHDAVDCERKDIVERLLLQKVNVNTRLEASDSCHYSRTPLLIAIARGNESIVNLLLDNGADPKICEDTGASPLMLAAAVGTQGMLASLLKKISRHDINQENTLVEGGGMYKTAVMYAACAGKSFNARFLLEQGANRENSQEIDVLECCLDDIAHEELSDYFTQEPASLTKPKNNPLSQENTLKSITTKSQQKAAVVLTESKHAPSPEENFFPVSHEKLSNDPHSFEQSMSQGRMPDKKEQQKQELISRQQSAEVEAFAKQIKNKNVVARVTEEFIKKGHIQEAASLLEETSHSSEVSPYWDIDGGFKAMALLGNGFNMKHAHYFMTRIKKDPSWRAKPAADALLKLAEKVTDGPAIQAMIMVMTALFETKYSDCDDLMEKITTIVGKATIDSHISFLFKSELESPVEIDSHISTWAEFENAIAAKSKTCLSLLNIGCSTGIAITFNDGSTIQFAKGITINARSIRSEKTAFAIPEEKLHLIIYDALKDKNKVAHVAQFALENKIISKETLANLFQRLIQEVPQSIKGYWDVDGGFRAMAMLDNQFNIIHADYFIDRINVGSQQSSAAAVDAIKKLASNITEEGAAAIPALSKIATYLKDNKPTLFSEVKNVLASRFKLTSVNVNDGGIQLTLLKPARTSQEGLFKQNSSLPASSKTVTPPSDQQTVKTQKKVVYNKANTLVKLPEQAKTSKTGVFKRGNRLPSHAVSKTIEVQDRLGVYSKSKIGTSRNAPAT